jgi:hypothetical protein
MALARVVAFEDVTPERIEELRSQIEGESPPEDLPASEIMILYDASGQRSLAIVFFDDEDAYARGDAALSAMPTDDTPGRRLSVDKYEVAIRMTA